MSCFNSVMLSVKAQKRGMRIPRHSYRRLTTSLSGRITLQAETSAEEGKMRLPAWFLEIRPYRLVCGAAMAFCAMPLLASRPYIVGNDVAQRLERGAGPGEKIV